MKLMKAPLGPPTIARDFDEVFDRVFNSPLAFPSLTFEPIRRAMEGTWMPAVDLTETEKDFILRAEIPGVPRENLDVHLESGVLTIVGHRETKTTEKGETMLWEEREAGKFVRTMRLPKPVDPAKVDALFQDGILTVRVPKADVAVKNKILIKG